jgi:hypothetical protein
MKMSKLDTYKGGAQFQIKSVMGTSMNLNTEKGFGGHKPSASAGTSNPGGTSPGKEMDGSVPIP